VRQVIAGATPGLVSARFHATMADVAAAMVRHGAARAGARRPAVVLTGGCFQNALLVESVCRRLAGEFDVRLHGQVPPGDGGVALGQAVVADAVARAGALAGADRAGAVRAGAES
jgi:hydrogenase maturation protein HypF